MEYLGLRDQLIAVPTIVATGPDIGAFASLVEPVVEVNPDEVDLPLTKTVHQRLTFRIVQGREDFNLILRGQLRMPLLVSNRFLYFAGMTKIIGLLFSNVDGDAMSVSSICAVDSEDRLPRVAGLMANADSSQIDNIVERSTRWEAYTIGNLSLFADSRDFNDDQYEIYEIRDAVKRVPQSTLQPKCFMCGTTGDITIEHCTPNWLMSRLGLHPVTAPIVCETCNGRLGDELERPMQDLYDSDTVLDEPLLASLWAVKTAVALALASNISVPDDLRQAVSSGDLAGTGVEVYATKIALDATIRFQYTVTRLRRSLVNKCFLFSFGFPGYGFLIVRWNRIEVGQLPTIDRIYPSGLPGLNIILKGQILPALLEQLSGDQFHFEPLEGTRIRSPRT